MLILLISFFAGVLTVLAPCVLPLLPIILWASLEDSKDKYRPYIIIFSLSISVILFSLLLKATTLFIGFNQSILTSFSGWIILFFGLITIFPNIWKKFSTKIGFAWKSNQWLGKSSTKSGFLWSVLIGFSLWPVFSSCSPTYAIILAVILPISFAFWFINLLAYVLWLAIVLLAIALLWQKFSSKLKWISDPKSMFKKVLWVIFLIVWLTILTGFDKKIEAHLIQKWFVWAGNFEQIFLDKIQDDISDLESNNYENEVETKKKTKNLDELDVAYFAWGCFWCIESIMDAHEWVETAISGYAWWIIENPTYRQVSAWNTGYREAVKVYFDSNIVSYRELTEIFFRQIDPTDDGWQFADRGFHYTTAIFYTDDYQKQIAEDIISKLNDSWEFDSQIVTKVIWYTTFTQAEEYHQNYSQKQSAHYKSYKAGSGRWWYIDDNEWLYESIFEEAEESLRWRLTPLQYEVTQNEATERPFDNEYWDNKEAWIYVDIIDWTPLFSSIDKYESGTGWPSFSKPLDENFIKEVEDNKLFTTRIEVRSMEADSHLWHVFEDGPKDDWGLRYCLNSASLEFISLDDLENKWYWEYKSLFE